MVQVGELLLDQFDVDERDGFKEELSESQYNHVDYAYVLKQILGKTKRSFTNRFMKEMQKLLKKRVQSIKYNGNSDIDKNLIAAKKMFNLTTPVNKGGRW